MKENSIYRKMKIKNIKSIASIFILVVICFVLFKVDILASGDVPLSFDINIGNNSDGAGVVSSMRVLLLLALVALAPSILVMLTSFTRIIVVLHFVRSALATQNSPPNQILIGIALLLTLFIMNPVITEIKTEAIEPYEKGYISQELAIERGMKPIREFMLKEVRTEDVSLFLDISGIGVVDELDEIPTEVIIPAFIISELRAAFIMGFLIYIPFIVIDMIVASALMSMGMMMLPPVMISMPFKLLLFIMADGWVLVIETLVKTFYD